MWRVILATAIILSPLNAANASNSFEDGNDLLELCTAAGIAKCYGYLEGVADAMNAGSAINGFQACIPLHVASGQLRDVVVQFLYQHAASRHLGAVGLTAAAFEEGFPCR